VATAVEVVLEKPIDPSPLFVAVYPLVVAAASAVAKAAYSAVADAISDVAATAVIVAPPSVKVITSPATKLPTVRVWIEALLAVPDPVAAPTVTDVVPADVVVPLLLKVIVPSPLSVAEYPVTVAVVNAAYNAVAVAVTLDPAVAVIAVPPTDITTVSPRSVTETVAMIELGALAVPVVAVPNVIAEVPVLVPLTVPVTAEVNVEVAVE
jgi:hypothetical protein